MNMGRKLRITFVLQGRGLAGGVRVVVKYANLLAERGHTVTIVSERSPYPRKAKSLLKRVRRDVSNKLGLSRDHVDDFSGTLIETAPGRTGDRAPDGDVVIATYWTTASVVRDLPARCGAKFYFIQHYEGHSSDPEQVDATWRMPLRKIVIARWLQRMAEERFGDSSAELVSNGVDLRQFDAPPRAMHAPPCVGMLYSQARWKGADVAAEAIRQARASVPDLAVVSFGQHPPTPELPLPAGARFVHRPAQERIREIYAAADVWLCASVTEGFALPPLEAMACRCPVVCTRCGGPEDFVVDGENGYLVNVGDAEDMARRIVEIVSDPARQQQMAAAAYATREQFTWSRAVERFEAALIAGVASKRDNVEVGR